MFLQKYKCTISYNGQNYHGWAKQNNNSITIQEIIEQKLTELFNQKIEIFSSGRTDKGVNAINQVIHFQIKNIKITTNNLLKAINNILPYDIHFKSAKKIHKDFHARYSAKAKIYKYLININKNYDPIKSSFIYQYNKKISIKKIKYASNFFIGKHNFLSFSTSTNKDNLIKIIEYIKFKKSKDLIEISIKGNGFLRSMVRMIVGSLLAINENKISTDKILNLLKNPKKGSSIYKAPACGLQLYKVFY